MIALDAFHYFPFCHFEITVGMGLLEGASMYSTSGPQLFIFGLNRRQENAKKCCVTKI